MDHFRSQVEIEVKIPVLTVAPFHAIAQELRLDLIQPYCHEINLRFDTPKRTLSCAGKVLRLRQENGKTILTFKANPQERNRIASRMEIETEISDSCAIEAILNGLGFEIYFKYEKYREVFQRKSTLIMLDHTPIGDFVEVEGPDDATIFETVQAIGADWQARTAKSYATLFEEFKQKTGFAGQNMIFQ